MSNTPQLYRIGTAASLTGVAVERLRAWERRYGLAPAQKSGRTRYYDADQVQQLSLIKRLTDQGHTISNLANLTVSQLEERLGQSKQSQTLVASHTPNIGLVGSNLIILEQAQQQNSNNARVEVLSRWANHGAYLHDNLEMADDLILCVLLPVLDRQIIEQIQRKQNHNTLIVVYQFGTSSQIDEAQDMGLNLHKWPISWDELEHQVISTHSALTPSQAHLPRLFGDEELIALSATTQDDSGFTHHTIELIQQLQAFSQFSASLEVDKELPQSRNNIDRARHELEQLLSALTDAQVEPAVQPTVGNEDVQNPPIQNLDIY